VDDEKEKRKKDYAPRYYRKRVELFLLIDKIKLWPSRKGVLHGIKSVVKSGNTAEITTHCGKHFRIFNSRNSRPPAGCATRCTTRYARSAGSPSGSWRSSPPPASGANTART